MNYLLYKFTAPLAPLAQVPAPWEEPERPAPKPVQHPLSFSDLQQSLRAYHDDATTDSHYRLGLLILFAAITVIGLFLYFRKRQKEALPPDSTRWLAWEIFRATKIPFAARLILIWVSRTAQVPIVTLLISADAFDRALRAWADQPTFSPIRRWGYTRLINLRTTLFA